MKTLATITLLLFSTSALSQSVPQVTLKYNQGDLTFTFGKDKLSELINGIQSLNTIPNSIHSKTKKVAEFQAQGKRIKYTNTIAQTQQSISKEQFWNVAISTILGIIADEIIKDPDTIKMREATEEFFRIAEIYQFNCLYRPK